MSRYKEIDLSRIKTYSIKNRKSKVKVQDFAKVFDPDSSFRLFLESLPHVLFGESFREFVNRVAQAVNSGKPVIVMMGAHVIKCGLSPILIDLMERGAVSGVAMNGAGSIHDLEIAYWGETSEEVAENLIDGSFGMARETAEIINNTISEASKEELGFGEALGRRIVEDNPQHKGFSILAKGYLLGIPVTVHVALGTDIVHQHPSADGASIGELSLRDFRIFARLISGIGGGGVVMNWGSAVILPEVFLKALTVARNLGYETRDFYTANFDMINHYRPRVNVLQRPTMEGGRGYQFIGYHEIMIPLLAGAIKAKIKHLEGS